MRRRGRETVEQIAIALALAALCVTVFAVLYLWL